MKLHTKRGRVFVSPDVQKKQCTAKVGVKMFRTLSGLYQNRIRAIIRELSTNAVDAQKVSGVTTPPQVTLPSSANRYFIIRDFGNAISPQHMDEVYLQYFNSDKEDTNDFNGCLGLGSKSPLYYAKSFTVESFLDGKMYIYSIFLDEDSIPNISKIAEADTDEENGVKVTVPVQERDIQTFHDEAKYVYSWFELQPRITNPGFHHTEHSFLFESDKESELKYKIKGNGISYIIMANVAYPIVMEGTSFSSKDKLLLGNSGIGAYIYVDNGEVMFTPSRENLDWTARTIANVRKYAHVINEQLAKIISESIDGQPSLWLARCKYNQIITDWNTNVTRGMSLSSITYKGKALYTSTDYRGRGRLSMDHIRRAFSRGWHGSVQGSQRGLIYPLEKIQFVLDDMKRGALSRCKELCLSSVKNHILLFPNDVKEEVKSHYGVVDSDFILASTLPAPVRAARSYKPRAKTTTIVKLKSKGHGPIYTAWENIDPPDGGFYIPIKNNWAFINGKKINPHRCSIISRLFEEHLGSADIYGIRPSMMKMVKDPKWMPIETKVREIVTIVDKLYHLKQTDMKKDVISQVLDSSLRKLVETYEFKSQSLNRLKNMLSWEIPTNLINIRLLVDTARLFSIDLRETTNSDRLKFKTSLKRKQSIIYRQYPLLRKLLPQWMSLNKEQIEHMVKYINHVS